MYGSNRQFTEQYRKVGVQSSVTDADPHKLVALLLATGLAVTAFAVAGVSATISYEKWIELSAARVCPSWRTPSCFAAPGA